MKPLGWRYPESVRKRHLAMVLLRRRLDENGQPTPLKEISRQIGKYYGSRLHHSTILYHLQEECACVQKKRVGGVSRSPKGGTTHGVIKAIAAFWEKNGYGPSIRDIQDGAYYSSTCAPHYQVELLEAAGYVTRNLKVARSIRLTAKGWKYVNEVA